MFSMTFSDPVVWGSLLGILIMIIMAGYYAYLFIHNSDSNDSDKD
jgi:ABC-type antimicrobial peptide transport system permease subunit